MKNEDFIVFRRWNKTKAKNFIILIWLRKPISANLWTVIQYFYYTSFFLFFCFEIWYRDRVAIDCDQFMQACSLPLETNRLRIIEIIFHRDLKFTF